MNEPDGSRPRIEDWVLTGLVLLFTIAFALVVEPFFAAILWAVIAAILFAPLNRRLLRRMPGRRNGAALLTLLLIVAIVIVPAILLTLALLQEAGAAYARLQAGAIDFAQLFERLRASLPEWVAGWLRRLGLDDFSAVQTRIAAGIAASVRTLAAQAFHIGQGAFSLLISLGVMLYLTFFLLRDGEWLMRRVIEATPLRPAQREALYDKFTVVVRATIKGSVVVAIVQGMIGGIVFWLIGIGGALLWGVLMGVLSLLPAVGTGIVWVPVAIYLFATGAVGQGIVLVLCGMFVIGLVDNILRPILVGRDTRMPDYVVLITTLGGLDLFGFSGLIIGPVIAALFIAIWNIVTTMRMGTDGARPAA